MEDLVREGKRLAEIARAIIAPKAKLKTYQRFESELATYGYSIAFDSHPTDYYADLALQAVAKLRGADLDAFWTALWDEREANGLEAMRPSRRTFLLSQHFNFDTSNGGLSQWFWNADGDVLVATPEALRALGDEGDATDIETGIALFPNLEMAEDWQRRRTYMQHIWDNKADDAPDPWEVPNGELFVNLEGLCWKWVLAHIADFQK